MALSFKHFLTFFPYFICHPCLQTKFNVVTLSATCFVVPNPCTFEMIQNGKKRKYIYCIHILFMVKIHNCLAGISANEDKLL